MSSQRVTPSALLDGDGDRWTVTDETDQVFTVERGGETQEVSRLDVASPDTGWRPAPSAGGGR